MARSMKSIQVKPLNVNEHQEYFQVVNVLELANKTSFNHLYSEKSNIAETVASFYGNDVIGGLIGSKLDSGIYFVRFLGVDPVFQEIGIGTSILAEAEKISRQRYFQRILFETPPQNIQWYQKRGYYLFDDFQRLRSNENRAVMSKQLV